MPSVTHSSADPEANVVGAEVASVTQSTSPNFFSKCVHAVNRILPQDEGPVARWRAWTLLFIFSMAQLLDIFNVTAPTVALPAIGEELHVEFAAQPWTINAYALTFGAFLLTGGRFSSIFGPKLMFVSGFTAVGICAIINGFAVNGPMLFVFRAFQGIGAAMTIPSALTLITTLFPERGEQDRALGIFAGFGAIGNVSGLVLGGVISELLHWRWIFWIMAMVMIPLSVLALFLAPPTPEDQKGVTKLRDMDWLGLGTITLCLILFVYSLTEGNALGWATGGILAPLIISILLLPVFGFIETKVKDPLVPPAVWTLPEFVPLFFITMSEYLVMNVMIYQESLIFQEVWGNTALTAALRIIPFGITGFIGTVAMGYLTPYMAPRWVLVFGQLLMMAGCILVAFAPTENYFWPRMLPSMILTALGVASGFVAANIAMLRTPLAKPSVKLHGSTALIGAIFNADLQVGSTLGLAIAAAITTRINGPGGEHLFEGYRGSFWFLVGVCAAEAIIAAVFLKNRKAGDIVAEVEDARASAEATYVEAEDGSAGVIESVSEKKKEKGVDSARVSVNERVGEGSGSVTPVESRVSEKRV
ncbi:hypothetical protein AX16_007625 [Volvariella volvacea WC 439]|nr:hypothetical protein AX16_007625 [Volvariella volvacea WC 439]